LAALLVCAALWAFCHPYAGIIGDSHLYIGNALAQLDPDGVGRDMTFVNDGQFRFSVFPTLIRSVVAYLGAGAAAQLLSAIASTCWFAAAFALARQFANGRAVWLVLLLVCALPHTYSYELFVTGETQAVPRPFAEAGVLAALACLSAGRLRLALPFLLLSFMIHPIMALPGIALVALLQLRGWRVLVALIAMAALAAALGLAGMPVFERLFAQIDGDWFEMLAQLSPYLFPTQWGADNFGRHVVQAATLAIAASLYPGFPRRLFVATCIVGPVGVLGAMVFGDLLHNLLVVQAQPWRSIWLMTVVAQFAYALCLIRLWPDNGDQRMIGRAVLAVLTLGWFCHPDLEFALILSAFALGLHFGRFSRAISPRYLMLTSIAALLVAGYSYLVSFIEFLQFLQNMPLDAGFGRLYALRMDVAALPICLAAALWFFLRPLRLIPPSAGQITAAVLIVAAFATWSSRSQASKDLETLGDPPEFGSVLANRPGEVLWVNGRDEAWNVLRRPEWASKQQSAGIVFSRPLAMHWRERAKMLLANGLLPSNVFRPREPGDRNSVLTVTREALDHVCTRDDAPVAVIFPVETGKPLSPGVSGAIWSLPHARYSMDLNGAHTWHEIDRYVAVSCNLLTSP
jgi:hypothetical protein